MLDLHALKAQDIVALSPSEWAVVGAQLLTHICEQSKHISAQENRIDSQAQAIKWRDAKIESITFQLARLKAWKFGAKTEAMNAEQRALFELMLEEQDVDIMAWAHRTLPVPERFAGPMIAALQKLDYITVAR